MGKERRGMEEPLDGEKGEGWRGMEGKREGNGGTEGLCPSSQNPLK